MSIRYCNCFCGSWSMPMPSPRDYLQVFKISKEGDQLKITHTQEVPAYRREYLLDAPVFVDKIYAIDDGEQSTMLLANEY